MKNGMFDGIWEFARSLTVFSADSSESRDFLGFLEPLSLTEYVAFERAKPFILPKERFRLIAHPDEDFFEGAARLVSCGGEMFEILAVKSVFLGEEITHRECVLQHLGEGGND